MQRLHYYTSIVHSKALKGQTSAHKAKAGGRKRAKDLIEGLLDLSFKVVPPSVFELFTSFLINKYLVREKKSFYPNKFVKYLGRGGQSLVFEVSTNQGRKMAYKVFQYSRLGSDHEDSIQRQEDFYQDTKLYKDKYLLLGDTYLEGVIRNLRKDTRWLDFHYTGRIANFRVLKESYSLALDPITDSQKTIAVTQELIDLSGEDVFSEDFLSNKAYKIHKSAVLPITRFFRRVLFTAKECGFVVDLLGSNNCVLTNSNTVVCLDPHNIYKVSGKCSRSKELNYKLSKITKVVDNYS